MRHAIGSAAVGLRLEVTCERHAAGTDHELRRLRLQIAAWPEQMRQVFTLRKVYRLHPRSVARRLCLSEQEVERYLIAAALACAGVSDQHLLPEPAADSSDPTADPMSAPDLPES
jgi:DNA-directed RNA polymerase specialized sigma24 family protein